MNFKKLFGKKKDMPFNVIVGLALAAALVMFLMKYNKAKSFSGAGMKNMSPYSLESEVENGQGASSTQAGLSAGVVGAGAPETNDYLSVSGMEATKPKVSSCNNEPVMDPKQLLPSDSEWSNIAPSKGLENVSFLSAGHNFGTNTVGSSLRNANLQVRSEPVIQKVNTGPWNESTIDADVTRKSLEIGGVFE
tara:strand:- start:47 stop:622 length:576 start_codon:yes stop_codon:yes gene_type:complete